MVKFTFGLYNVILEWLFGNGSSRIWIVKKEHRRPKWINGFLRIYLGSYKMKRTFVFTPTFTKQTKDQVNKLFGFSFGNHHKNSYRFGWSNSSGRIGIWAYYYTNGERTQKKLIEIDHDDECTFIIKYKRKSVSFTMSYRDKEFMSYEVYGIKKKLFGYSLGFYIGGTVPAISEILYFQYD
jgi:hypothetical protein